ncbi:MAG: type II toxin-antitoxin system PemK/MazF family toxin [Oscillospiraceae bacterium]
MVREIKRGDIDYADLGIGVGSEQNGIRPVLVVSNDVGNRFSQTAVVIPITARKGKPPMPTHIRIDAPEILYRESVILAEQIRTIDRKRLGRYLGTLDNSLMNEADRAIKISLGVE